eukprot:6474072-Amphidinium_carterae.1
MSEELYLEPQPSWFPMLQLLLHVEEVIYPPAALASAHRNLEHKVKALVYGWALQTDSSVRLDNIADSFVSVTADLGVEAGISSFMCKRPISDLLPPWLSNEPMQVDIDPIVPVDYGAEVDLTDDVEPQGACQR